jgi:hypothetical protein
MVMVVLLKVDRMWAMPLAGALFVFFDAALIVLFK